MHEDLDKLKNQPFSQTGTRISVSGNKKTWLVSDEGLLCWVFHARGHCCDLESMNMNKMKIWTQALEQQNRSCMAYHSRALFCAY